MYAEGTQTKPGTNKRKAMAMAQRLSKAFMERFAVIYSLMEETGMDVTEIAHDFDEEMMDPAFKEKAAAFNKLRGDFITSDREAAAFMLTNDLM